MLPGGEFDGEVVHGAGGFEGVAVAAEELGVFESVGAALAAGPDMVDFEHVEGEVLVAAVAVAFLLSVEGVLDLTAG